MRDYLIDDEFRTLLIRVLGEVPGKLSADPLLRLHQLKPVNADVEDTAEAK